MDDPEQHMIITVVLGVLAMTALVAAYLLCVKMSSPQEIVLDVRQTSEPR